MKKYSHTQKTILTLGLTLFLLASSGCTNNAKHDETYSLEINNPWLKATESSMTGAFGELKNNTDKNITIISASSAQTKKMELHETYLDTSGVGTMRKVDSFVIPAGGDRILAPGEDHIMLMDLEQPIPAGTNIDIVLHTDSGQQYSFSFLAKNYSGANEEYDH